MRDTSACVDMWTCHGTSAAGWESLAISLRQSFLCPQTEEPCLDLCQGASSSECHNPLSVLALLRPLPPSPESPLPSIFCSLAFLLTHFSSFLSVATHLFSPPASHPSATASCCSQLFNTPPLLAGTCVSFLSLRTDFEV